jgi:C4-type Zn-finger protein
MGRLDDFVEGRKFPFTLELHDPLGNSFISFHGTR